MRSNWIIFHTFLAGHLQIDADYDPDPAYHLDADPYPDSAYHFDADPHADSAYHFDADPYHTFILIRIRNTVFLDPSWAFPEHLIIF
jgi:hypothetical protein